MRLRRTVLALLVCSPLVACGGTGAPSEDIGATSSPLTASQLADDALNDMLSRAVINPGKSDELHGFWDTKASTFAQKNTGYGAEFARTGYWTNAQALDAVLDGVERTKGKEFTDWIPKVVAVCETQFGGWFEKTYDGTWFDDISWMALALIRAYDVASKYHLPNAHDYLDDARYIFDGVVKYGPKNGPFEGIWWTMKPNIEHDLSVSVPDKDITHENDERATASNFTPVIAAARLAERTGDSATKKFYEDFAIAVYDYWRNYAHADGGYVVQKQSDGSLFVADNISNGKLSASHFTYNQGVGIGAALELATVDPGNRAKYLADAHAMGNYLVNHEVVQLSSVVGQTYGGIKQTRPWKILIDGNPKSPALGSGSAVGFKGVAFRYLLELYDHDIANPSERDPNYGVYLEVLNGSFEGIVFIAHSSPLHEVAFRWDLPFGDQDTTSGVEAFLKAEGYSPPSGETLEDEAASVVGDAQILGTNASAVMAIQLFTEATP